MDNMPEPQNQILVLVVSAEVYNRLLEQSNPIRQAVEPVLSPSQLSETHKLNLVSEDQAKIMLGRSTSSLWRYTRKHHLTKIKKLGRNYYIREEIERLSQAYPLI